MSPKKKPPTTPPEPECSIGSPLFISHETADFPSFSSHHNASLLLSSSLPLSLAKKPSPNRNENDEEKTAKQTHAFQATERKIPAGSQTATK
jgi:hypothetical protein